LDSRFDQLEILSLPQARGDAAFYNIANARRRSSGGKALSRTWGTKHVLIRQHYNAANFIFGPLILLTLKKLKLSMPA